MMAVMDMRIPSMVSRLTCDASAAEMSWSGGEEKVLLKFFPFDWKGFLRLSLCISQFQIFSICFDIC